MIGFVPCPECEGFGRIERDLRGPNSIAEDCLACEGEGRVPTCTECGDACLTDDEQRERIHFACEARRVESEEDRLGLRSMWSVPP